MKNSSTLDLFRLCMFAAHRAMHEHVGVELGFNSKAGNSSVQSPFLVGITDISESRIVFCFQNKLPRVYSVTNICFHDDGLLGFAAAMGYVNDPDVESPLNIFKSSIKSNQPYTHAPPSTLNINSDSLTNISTNVNSNVYGRYGSWVVIFDLKNDAGFARIIYALNTGRLRINLRVQDLETGSYTLLFNKQMLTLGQPGCRRQSGSSALLRTA